MRCELSDKRHQQPSTHRGLAGSGCAASTIIFTCGGGGLSSWPRRASRCGPSKSGPRSPTTDRWRPTGCGRRQGLRRRRRRRLCLCLGGTSHGSSTKTTLGTWLRSRSHSQSFACLSRTAQGDPHPLHPAEKGGMVHCEPADRRAFSRLNPPVTAARRNKSATSSLLDSPSMLRPAPSTAYRGMH